MLVFLFEIILGCGGDQLTNSLFYYLTKNEVFIRIAYFLKQSSNRFCFSLLTIYEHMLICSYKKEANEWRKL